MELQAKLDEDFLFYLNFTDTFLKRIASAEIQQKCEEWLAKLLSEPCEGVDKKRCRNMYLSNLLISMHNGVLEKPFSEPAHGADIRNAFDIFGPVPSTIEPPEWLEEKDFDPNNVEVEPDEKKKQGRTYVATRTLPNGQGAIAYVGVSLTEKEPMWLGAGEGYTVGDQCKCENSSSPPDLNEFRKILSRRKDPQDREKVLAFYDILLQNIADELDGKETAENEIIEGLLIQLVHDLMDKGEYHCYEKLSEKERRNELLLLLFDRVKIRRDKVQRREEILDNLEEKLRPRSLFNLADRPVEDKYKLPVAMWEQAIDKIPSRKQMESLQKAYPFIAIEKFLIFLADYKEKIALRMQMKHDSVVREMKKELRKEGEKKKKSMQEAERALENSLVVLEAVREQYNNKLEEERKLRRNISTLTAEEVRLGEQMKTTVIETQKLVEDEALRGKYIASQINSLSEQNEKFRQQSEEMLSKLEDVNNKMLKNIWRLKASIHQYEQMKEEFAAKFDEEKICEDV